MQLGHELRKLEAVNPCRALDGSVQLHGGMRMTEEKEVSHSFRGLTMIAQRCGDAEHHLERYAGLG